MSFKLSKLLIVTGMVRWSCVPFKVPDSSGSDHIFKALLKYFVKYHEIRVINRMSSGVGEYLLITLYVLQPFALFIRSCDRATRA